MLYQHVKYTLRVRKTLLREPHNFRVERNLGSHLSTSHPSGEEITTASEIPVPCSEIKGCYFFFLRKWSYCESIRKLDKSALIIFIQWSKEKNHFSLKFISFSLTVLRSSIMSFCSPQIFLSLSPIRKWGSRIIFLRPDRTSTPPKHFTPVFELNSCFAPNSFQTHKVISIFKRKENVCPRLVTWTNLNWLFQLTIPHAQPVTSITLSVDKSLHPSPMCIHQAVVRISTPRPGE